MQMLLTCSCGHLHLYVLPITLGILYFAVVAYINPMSRTLIGLVGLAVAVLFVGKHLADICLLGHDPIFTFN